MSNAKGASIKSLGHSIKVREVESTGRSKISFKPLIDFLPLVAGKSNQDYETTSNLSMRSASGEPLKKKNYRVLMDIYERRYVGRPKKLKILETKLDQIQEAYEAGDDADVEQWKDLLSVDVGDNDKFSILCHINHENHKEYLDGMMEYEYMPNQFVATLEKVGELIKEDISEYLDKCC
eukprot:CAMPEP_0170499882 /NCGR_PEP_ID=MMETSP0208-20121228/32958_1 /TAXON_ID=197538 /ORGANISM="Strombidium inclinatum, Strain S3" /LENGTH=178 /DNA_ID=CAMNT_0010777639 /DNA_START=690 /DNA_END=1223 /DNA_ORIENTATION=+